MPLTESSRAVVLEALADMKHDVIFHYNKIVGADGELAAIDAAIAELREGQEVPAPDWNTIAYNHNFLEVSEFKSGEIMLFFKELSGSRGMTTNEAYMRLQSLVYGLLQAQELYGDTTLLQRRP